MFVLEELTCAAVDDLIGLYVHVPGENGGEGEDADVGVDDLTNANAGGRAWTGAGVVADWHALPKQDLLTVSVHSPASGSGSESAQMLLSVAHFAVTAGSVPWRWPPEQ